MSASGIAVPRTPPPADRLLARAVQSAADAIFCSDVAGVVLTWNVAAEDLYGLPAEQIVGRDMAIFTPEDSRAELNAAHARAAHGERVGRFDSVHCHHDGRRIAIAVSMAPVRDDAGRVEAVVTTVADIGSRIRRATDLGEVRAELGRNNDALRRSNRDLEQFAYVASHDLSEPLRVMTGYVAALERRYDGQLDERGLRYMHHIVEASARMRSLIDDLLEYARFLRAPRAATRVEVGAVLQQTLASLSRAMLDAGAGIEIGPLPAVCGDERQLASLLQNLVGNALKFTSPGRPPQVVVTAVESGGWVTLRVDDNGIGISPEYRDRVFRMFQRLHVREAYAGTGIGLAIAQQIVELAGGRIWVEDSPLGGARLCCTLPSWTEGVS